MLVIKDHRGNRKPPRTKEDVMDRIIDSIGSIGATEGERTSANRLELKFEDGKTFEVEIHRPRSGGERSFASSEPEGPPASPPQDEPAADSPRRGRQRGSQAATVDHRWEA